MSFTYIVIKEIPQCSFQGEYFQKLMDKFDMLHTNCRKIKRLEKLNFFLQELLPKLDGCNSSSDNGLLNVMKLLLHVNNSLETPFVWVGIGW